MDIFEMITDTEKEMIISYIKDYAFSKKITSQLASFEHIFFEWNRSKNNLFHLLDNKLMVSKEICVEKDKLILESEMTEKCMNTTFVREYFKKTSQYCDDTYGEDSWNSFSIRAIFNRIMTSQGLVKNIYNDSDYTFIFGDKTLKLQKGMKRMKFFQKLSEYLNIDGFEEFRILHSQVLNQKFFKGELVLSIHPLDFMTMSDNDCGWSSCMSWKNEGEFRVGTVEMMNSPMVIVAYIKSQTPMTINGNPWSNKKWRSLYIVDKDIISSVKGYPYCSDELNKIVMNWIKELAEENWNIVFHNKYYEIVNEHIYNHMDNKEFFQICLDTDNMYNDCYHISCYISEECFQDDSIEIYKNFSGEATCMHCGKFLYLEEDEEEVLICDECLQVKRCVRCGCKIFDNSIKNDNDYDYCEDCYHQVVDICPISGKVMNKYDEEVFIYLNNIPNYSLLDSNDNPSLAVYTVPAIISKDCIINNCIQIPNKNISISLRKASDAINSYFISFKDLELEDIKLLFGKKNFNLIKRLYKIN